MYKVIKISAFSPAELEKMLNQIYEQDGYELIAVDNGYYIFRQTKEETTPDGVGKPYTVLEAS
jgi:hypothetical protein